VRAQSLRRVTAGGVGHALLQDGGWDNPSHPDLSASNLPQAWLFAPTASRVSRASPSVTAGLAGQGGAGASGKLALATPLANSGTMPRR
jgi:hypothetical protein